MKCKTCPIICTGYDNRNKVCKFGIPITIETDIFLKRLRVPNGLCYAPQTMKDYDDVLKIESNKTGEENE
jgi:hypothetical protein